jgi:hypothetical protein
MALDYTVYPDQRLVVISGEFTSPSEWMVLAGRLLGDTRVNAGFAFLRDLRGIHHTHSATTVLSVFRVVQRFWPNFNPFKGAIVTDDGNHHAAQVAQALADSSDLPIRVFTSYEEAVEWLALQASRGH